MSAVRVDLVYFVGSILVVCLKKIGWGRISRWPFRRQKRVSGRIFENVVGDRGGGLESSWDALYKFRARFASIWCISGVYLGGLP